MVRKKIGASPVKEIREAPLSLKVRPSLKLALTQAAEADGRTVSQFTERLLESAMREAGFLK
jgi:uncharacterized protein (DUF1778 family)